MTSATSSVDSGTYRPSLISQKLTDSDLGRLVIFSVRIESYMLVNVILIVIVGLILLLLRAHAVLERLRVVQVPLLRGLGHVYLGVHRISGHVLYII